MMTSEKAIQLLHRLSNEQFDGIHGDERREALSMAVRALEGDGDMISRQAVMKEFSDFVRKSNNSDFAQTPTWNDAVSLVGSMPSAQPEQRYTEEELRVFKHGISLSLLSKRSSQHWQYDEDTATEIKFLERLYEKVSADMRGAE